MDFQIFGKKNKEPAECIIEIDGLEISDLYPFLTEVTVDIGRSEAAEVAIVFETRRNIDGTWIIQDDERLQPWTPFKIIAAFGEHREEIIRGFIRQIKAEYPEEIGTTSVSVICQDDSIIMDREHHPYIWGESQPVTDKYIFSEIISRYPGLTMDKNCGRGLSDLRIQQSKRDSQFVRLRAEANGFELIFQQGVVYFGPLRLDMAPQDTIMVYAGHSTNCNHFSIDENGHLPDKVVYEIAGRDKGEKIREEFKPDIKVLGKRAANSESMGLNEFSWRLEGQGGRSENEMRALAQAKANINSFKITATGALDGSLYGHVLRIAEPVGVDGVGEKYSGIYYVDRVTHKFNYEGYFQNFSLIRNAYGNNLEIASTLDAGSF